MSPSLSDAIALWAGGTTFLGMAAILVGGEVFRRLRKGGGEALPGAGGFLGGIIILAIPSAVATFVALFGTALIVAAGTPPLVYLFVSLAALAGFVSAFRSSSYGMDGCSRMIGLVAAAYVAVWGGVAFVLTGGPERLALDATNLAWLTPPLAALPFALILARLTGSRRTRWTFPGAWIVFTAFMASIHLPVEAGLGARWLPASDWLRFPLAGLVAGLALSSIQLLGLVGINAAARALKVRAMPLQTLLFAVSIGSTGLAWAAARTAIGLMK